MRIDYTGRPGVHIDGDGSTEGWFRVNTTAAPNDGSFVTTEPVGTASWLPLNNHPSAKPTYDFYDTVPVGKTAIANGELVGATIGSTFTDALAHDRQRARRELPRGLVDVALALAGADRELPRREQHRLLRPRRPHEPRPGSRTTRGSRAA